jgi:hypothetical protein
MRGLEGKVAIVTGGSTGIGRANQWLGAPPTDEQSAANLPTVTTLGSVDTISITLERVSWEGQPSLDLPHSVVLHACPGKKSCRNVPGCLTPSCPI